MHNKKKAIQGFSWSFVENLGKNILVFFIGIILTRYIEPSDYGIVGVVGVFLTILPIFSDGGFSTALIQKKQCNDSDLNSVFYFNILISLIIYLTIYFLSPFISDYFNLPELEILLKILGLDIIINSFGAIQIVVLTKKIEFNKIARVSIISNAISGFIAIILAYYEFGVWALVIKTLLNSSLSVLLLFSQSSWFPSLSFDFSALKKLFKFGSNLLLSNIINSLFNNSYYFIIGKYYSTIQLGYFSRADTLSKLPSQNLTSIIQRVSFPILSDLQDDIESLKKSYKKLLVLTTFISSIIMLVMAASSNALILTLLGEKWVNSIHYLQLMCLGMFLYPVHALNLNIMNVRGRSDLFLKAEIIKKIILIPIIIVGLTISIEHMLVCLIIFSIIALIINVNYGGRLIDYSLKQQLKDIFIPILFSISVAIIVFLLSFLITSLKPILILGLQLLISLFLTVTLGELTKFTPYNEIKNVIKSAISKLNINKQ